MNADQRRWMGKRAAIHAYSSHGSKESVFICGFVVLCQPRTTSVHRVCMS